jgi:hypothetical protein
VARDAGPLALGVTTGTFAGRFDAVRLMKALQDYRITNMSAAATHYRMMMNSGKAGDYRFAMQKLSYTGDPSIHTLYRRNVPRPCVQHVRHYRNRRVLVNYPARGLRGKTRSQNRCRA